MNLLSIVALAAPASGTAQPQGAGSMLTMLLPFVVIIGVMYLFMIRPQKKKEKLKQEMLSQLIVGDRILTIGGIHGKIVSVKDDTLIIETGKASADEKSTIKISRWAVSEVTKPGEETKAVRVEEPTAVEKEKKTEDK